MRYILIDLSSDNYLQQPNLFGGYEGEHNETILQVRLPKRMIDIECSGYRFDFQTSEDNKIFSPLIPVSELNNDVLSFHLTQQLTIAGKLLFNVVAILSDENTVSLISKTNTVTLRIEDAVDGNMQLIDPNGYKDELQKMIDERILEINPAKVDQTYTPESENAQSGKSVAEALSIEQKRANNTFANALKGSKSGSAISVNDVSVVEHSLGVSVKRKNLLSNLNYIEPKNLSTEIGYSEKIHLKASLSYTFSIASINNATSWRFVAHIYENGVMVSSGSDKRYSTEWFTTNLDGSSSLLYSGDSNFFIGQNNRTELGNITIKITAKKDCEICFGLYFGDITADTTVTNPQFELGTTATSYTPYITDLTTVNVTRCGKNLTTPQQVYKGASFYSEEIFENKNCVRFSSATTIKNSPIAFKPNTQYTVSFDVKTILRSGQTTSNVDNVFCFFYDDGTRSVIQNIYTQTDWVHKVLTSTVGKTVVAVGLYTVEYRSYSYVDIDSFQLEEGSIATPHEPYQAQKYIPSADGTVPGVKSLYPTTTLMTDTEGAIIEAEYNRDINKAFAELQQAILSMGGNT